MTINHWFLSDELDIKTYLKKDEGVSKNMILEFLDLAIRDAKAKAAYAS